MSQLKPFRFDRQREVEYLRKAPALNVAFGRMVGDPVRSAILNRIGVFSVCDTPTSWWMWSMYADSHRGIALQFDGRPHIFDNVVVDRPPFGTFHEVMYVQRRPSVAALELMTPIERWGRVLSRRVLFTKSACCRNERERRMVLPLDDHGRYPHVVRGRLHLFKVAAAAIRRVIISTDHPSPTSPWK